MDKADAVKLSMNHAKSETDMEKVYDFITDACKQGWFRVEINQNSQVRVDEVAAVKLRQAGFKVYYKDLYTYLHCIISWNH